MKAINKKSPYDIVLVHENLSTKSDDEVFRLLKTLFPEHGLYRMSVDWRKDKGYILKARGTKGDIIVGWVEDQSIGQTYLKHCPIL